MRKSKIYGSILIFLFILGLNLKAQDKEKVKECLLVIEKGKPDTILTRAYNELATEFLGSADEKAKQYAMQGLELSNKLNNKYFQSWSLNLIGMSFDYLGKPDSALLNYQKAISVKKQINDIDGLGAVYMNIGVLYYYQNNTDKAIAYYNQSMEYYTKANNQKRIAGILNNIGIIYRQEKKYAKAVETFEKAFEIKSKANDTTGMANALGNLGVVYQYMGEYKKAELYHLKSMRLDSLKTNNYNLVSSYISLAELNFYTKNYNEVKRNLERAIAKGSEINAIHYLDDAYLLYTKLDSTIGDYNAAYFHLKKFNYFNDEILKDDRIKQMDKLETIFSFKEKEQQINLLNATAEIKELKIKEQSKQILIFIISSILLISLLVLIALSYKRIKKQRKELQQKNEIIHLALLEKETLLKEIHHRVKNNLQVISSLLSIQSRYITDSKALNAINESKDRLNAISFLHQELYQNETLKSISIKTYFEKLLDTIQNTFDPSKKTTFNIQVQDTLLDVDTLMSLGLIVNELLTNAFKYGCTNKNPHINFSLSIEKNKLQFNLKDNGIGIDQEYIKNTTNSLGLKLIQLFTQKLKGEINYRNENGTEITFNCTIKNAL